MYVCMYVCNVCTYVCICMYKYIQYPAHQPASDDTPIPRPAQPQLNSLTNVCMYACMYACKYVMYVCMYVCICKVIITGTAEHNSLKPTTM